MPSVARRWQEQGDLIHVVDLNGAVDGEPKNLPQIEAVMKTVSVKVTVGGGIRTIETVRKYLQAEWPESCLERQLTIGNFWLRPVVSFPVGFSWGWMRGTARWRSRDGPRFRRPGRSICSRNWRSMNWVPSSIRTLLETAC